MSPKVAYKNGKLQEKKKQIKLASKNIFSHFRQRHWALSIEDSTLNTQNISVYTFFLIECINYVKTKHVDRRKRFNGTEFCFSFQFSNILRPNNVIHLDICVSPIWSQFCLFGIFSVVENEFVFMFV